MTVSHATNGRWDRRRRWSRGASALGSCALLLVLAGCGARSLSSDPGSTATPSHDSASTTTSAVACVLPSSAPAGASLAGTVTLADRGKAICLDVGRTLEVLLSVPPADSASRFGPIAVSDATIARPVLNSRATLMVGATAIFLEGMKPGVVTVSSSRPSGETWHATIVVRGH